MQTIEITDAAHEHLTTMAEELGMLGVFQLADTLLTWTAEPGQHWREQAIEMLRIERRGFNSDQMQQPIIEPDPDNVLAAATNSRKAMDKAKSIGTLFVESFPQGPVRTLAQEINLLSKRVDAAVDRIETGMYEVQGLRQRVDAIDTMSQAGVALDMRVYNIEALLANLGLSFAEYDQDH